MNKVTRRSFLTSAALVSAAGSLPAFAGTTEVHSINPVVLEDDNLRVTFDRKYGSLLTLENKQTGWRVQDRVQFGSGFRMQVPLAERQYNFVTEKDNPLQDVEMHPGNRGVTFTWSKLNSPHAGALDINLRATASLNESGLVFTTDIDNRSNLIIQSLAYPILGDISLPDQSKVLSRCCYGYGDMAEQQLFPNFHNDNGYYGTDHPMQSALTPSAQFVLVFADSEGLYAGYHDVGVDTLARFQFQLEPGWADSLDSSNTDAKLHTDFSHIDFRIIQFPYVHPNQRKVSPPIVLRLYKGSWHAGADLYREWRETWFTPPVSPAWVKEVHSWQQIQINSSEDRLLFPYKQLIEYGKDCAKHGVRAIQLTGWNQGGQDRNNPSHDTDPRLGSADDLRNAIEECRKIGVEVILFNKYNWADSSTEWYKKELYRYASRDPYGNPYIFSGYEYDTPAQLSDINTRRLVSMCTACPAWREIAFKEFQKSVELKAGGILQDEVGWHGAQYCFAADHGHPVPAFIFSGDQPLAEGFRERIDPEHFLMSGEAPWDLQTRYYTLYYSRIDGATENPLQRYVSPHLPMMIAATGYDDRQMINRALIYRYVISYEPLNFKGRLDDFPLTIEYGGKVDALRRRYKDYLWDAEFRDKVGASVKVGGKLHSQYTVFVNHGTQRRAIAIANPSNSDDIVCQIDLPNVRPLSVVTPESFEPKSFNGQLQIPAESAAILLEL